MLNIFYINAGLWLFISVLYSFGWSDLCVPFSAEVSVFLTVIILSSLAVGYVLRDKFRWKLATDHRHKPYLTGVLVLFFVADFLYEKYIPLLSVLRGHSMYEKGFDGIPFLHVLVSTFTVFYCFYLVYLFVSRPKWYIIPEYVLCTAFFVLLFQRQNIAVVFAGSVWIVLLYFLYSNAPKAVKGAVIGVAGVCIIGVLYVFGLIGNVRYGIWGAHDSSMIMEVGRINSRYPGFLPKEFAWAYIYLTSPLANLQYNIAAGLQVGATAGNVLYNFLPIYVSKLFGFTNAELLLPSPALIVCTAYAEICRCVGVFGMYLLYLYELLLLVVALFASCRLKRVYIPFVIGYGYFLFLSFFDNPIVYTTSSMMVLLPIVYAAVLPLFRRCIALWKNRKCKTQAGTDGATCTVSDGGNHPSSD